MLIDALLVSALMAGTAGFVNAQSQVSTQSTAAAQSPVEKNFYNRNGKLLYTIDYYGEKELPAAVRDQVKAVYYDFTIMTVEEVKQADKHIYFVDLEDATRLKKVRVCDGEMEEVVDLVRGDAQASRSVNMAYLYLK